MAKKTGWVLIGRVVGLVIQAAYFVLMARLLPVAQYGLFSGIFAVVNTITPYSALGASMLFMRYLAVSTTHARRYWGNGLFTTAAFTVLVIVATAIYRIFTPSFVHFDIAIALLISNCLFYQVTLLGGMLLYAMGDARAFSWMNILSSLFRLLVLVIMWAGLHKANALQWSLGVLTASLVAALVVYGVVTRKVGTPQIDFYLLRKRFFEGIGFSFAGTTEAVNNDLDKVMLARYGMYIQNGFYTLAYRVLDAATSPIVAFNTVVMQRHFQIAHTGKRRMMGLLVNSTAISAAMGIVIATALWFASPLLPHLTGRDFSGAVSVLRYLCLLPFIRGIQQMAGSMVTGAGRQAWRTGAQAIVAVLNLVLNVYWIQSYGWYGAARSTLVSDGTLAILNVCLVFIVIRTHKIPRFEPVVASEEML